MEKLYFYFCFVFLIVPIMSQNIITDALIKEDIAEKCFNATGNLEFSNKLIKEATDQQTQCEDRIIDKMMFQRDIEMGVRSNELNKVFNKYCHKLDDLFVCGHNYYQKLDVCINDDDKEELADTMKIIIKMKNYLCSEDGDLLGRFFMEGGPACIEQNQYKLAECFQILISMIESLNTTNTIDDNFLCKIIEKINDCVVPIIGTCETDITLKLTQGMVNVLEKDLSCNNDHVIVSSVYNKNYKYNEDQYTDGSESHGLSQLLIIFMSLCIYFF